MSNTSLLQFNHDYCPKNSDLLDWAEQIRMYLQTADKCFLPDGIKQLEFRHSDDSSIYVRKPERRVP